MPLVTSDLPASDRVGVDPEVTPDELRARRLALGLTQAQLARHLNVAANTVARWERGEIRIGSPTRLSRWLDLLEKSPGASHVSAPTSHNLPAESCNLLGRDRDLALIHDIASSTRVLTLVGPGGVGKTSLALRLAHQLQKSAPGGTCWVDLTSVLDPSLLAESVAFELAVDTRRADPLPQLIAEHIGIREHRLVFDNCEHLLGQCAELLAYLVDRCPGARFIATSREPLRITGERLWRVAPLQLPPPTVSSIGELCASPAIQLFSQRARSAKPGFQLTSDAQARRVADICRQLDGLPLAIELAAGRVNLLSLEQIGNRLRERFELLISGTRSAPERHRALRTTVDWTYDQLSAGERNLFDQLGVFAAGFTLEAAEAVVGPDDPGTAQVLNLLDLLVDRSLVSVIGEADGRARYGMLETLRLYARDRLRDSGKLHSVQRAHALYYLGQAQELNKSLTNERQRSSLASLEGEHGNLQAALLWAVESGEHGIAMAFGAALWRFWRYRGHIAEADTWLTRLQALPGPWTRDRLSVVFGAAMLAARQGRRTKARACFERVLCEAEKVGNDVLAAAAQTHVAFFVADDGDLETAEHLHQQALSVRRRLHRDWELIVNLIALGRLAVIRGDKLQARKLQMEALEVALATGDDYLSGEALRYLAMLDCEEGQLRDARARLTESLNLDWRLGLAEAYLLDLECFVVLMVNEENPRLALQLMAAARAERERVGIPSSPGPLLRPALETARRALGDEESDRMWIVGSAKSVTWAIERAINAAVPRVARRPVGLPNTHVLSARELQVLRLIADARSNRDIARALVISEHTVARHVANIFNKLGIVSRTGVATFAVRNGLV